MSESHLTKVYIITVACFENRKGNKINHVCLCYDNTHTREMLREYEKEVKINHNYTS